MLSSSASMDPRAKIAASSRSRNPHARTYAHPSAAAHLKLCWKTSTLGAQGWLRCYNALRRPLLNWREQDASTVTCGIAPHSARRARDTKKKKKKPSMRSRSHRRPQRSRSAPSTVVSSRKASRSPRLQNDMLSHARSRLPPRDGQNSQSTLDYGSGTIRCMGDRNSFPQHSEFWSACIARDASTTPRIRPSPSHQNASARPEQTTPPCRSTSPDGMRHRITLLHRCITRGDAHTWERCSSVSSSLPSVCLNSSSRSASVPIDSKIDLI